MIPNMEEVISCFVKNKANLIVKFTKSIATHTIEMFELCVDYYLFTWTPFMHNAFAVANATLESCPLRRTLVVPGGILLRSTAVAKLLPSTILNFNFGYF